ncbi:molybdopterin-binding protein [Jannaschia sp. CCS1]|uniref:molybdopterin-binding protein n=1 Tax=Jannaschia sp. (strain CCS1) TaxID=290400 RepID=UPI000053B50C|nr:molybdopterin-binding protein [Jannaschia sp. CCS1]ABD54679.1 molybdopterin biosynthesis protein [Jannaschia sp. CCS1]
MRFGEVPVGAAEGAILAHSVIAADPINPASLTYKIAKGTCLTAEHIRDLAANDVVTVVVARLDAGDIHEDDAATRIARALCGPGLLADGAATGRVNLRAESAGIVQVDAEAIEQVNRINPAMTVATVAQWTRLEARGLAVTVKIIPFAAREEDVAAACAIGQGAVRLREGVIGSATLIETQVGAPLSEKGRRSVKGRLDRFSVLLSERVVVDHDIASVAGALVSAPGELLLILTGSATSDSADTAPEAVRAAGGEVIHYGMPVDPGNLLFIGRLGAKIVIGLPGCARSPALNGADWVMERVICGIAPEDLDIPGMGVGGLLKEIPSRPRPREG